MTGKIARSWGQAGNRIHAYLAISIGNRVDVARQVVERTRSYPIKVTWVCSWELVDIETKPRK